MKLVWDPKEKDSILEDVLIEIVEKMEAGELPWELKPIDLKNSGDPRLRNLVHVVAKDKRPKWSKDYFPDTIHDDSRIPNDYTGWKSLIEKLRILSDNGVKDARHSHIVHTNAEKKDVDYVASMYRDGEIDLVQAAELLEGVRLNAHDQEMFKGAYNSKHKAVEDKVMAIRKPALDITQRKTRLPKMKPEEKDDSKKVYGSINRLRRQAKKLEDTVKFQKIKSQRPICYLGDIYQNFVGFALDIAYMDERVEEEVALTTERDASGKLTKTQNIVDFMLLEGYKKRTKSYRDVYLIEVKLGRQKGKKLKEQIESEIAAAKAKGYQNVKLHLLSGQLDESEVFEKFKKKYSDFDSMDMKVLERFMNCYQSNHKKEFKNAIINKEVEEIFKDNPDVEVMHLSDVLEKVQDTISKKIRAAAVHSCGKKLDKKKLRLHEAMYSLSITLPWVGFNGMMQRRYLDMESLKKIDKNIYLMRYHVQTKLKQALQSRNFDKVIGTLMEMKQLMASFGSAYFYDHRIKGQNRYLLKKATEFMAKKKLNLDVDYSLLESQIIDFSKAEIFSKYIDVEKALSKRPHRNDILIEEKGIHRPFTKAKRVFQKNKSGDKNIDWVVEQMGYLGMDVSPEELEDKDKLNECVSIIKESFDYDKENFKNQTKKLRSDISNLEKICDTKEFSKLTGSRLNHYQHILKNFGLEEHKDNLQYLKTVYKRGKWSKLCLAVPVVLGYMLPFKGKNFNIPSFLIAIQDSSVKKSMVEINKAHKKFVRTKDIDLEKITDYKNELRAAIEKIPDRVVDYADYYRDYKNAKSKLIKASKIHSVFTESKLPARYLAGYMLQITMKTEALMNIDEEAGKKYFDLARQELKKGKDYGSKEVVEKTLNLAKEQYKEQNELIKQYVLEDNSK